MKFSTRVELTFNKLQESYRQLEYQFVKPFAVKCKIWSLFFAIIILSVIIKFIKRDVSFYH